MAAAEDFIVHNQSWVTTSFPGPRPLRPARALAIVACMDSRMDLFSMLGLGPGDAHVIRNAGGVVTDDVIRSIVLSQRLMGTTEIVLVHHTDCGLTKISEDQLRHELEVETGIRPSFAFEAFRDPFTDVRQSIARLKASPFLPALDAITGFVYDVDDGHLHQVDNQPN